MFYSLKSIIEETDTKAGWYFDITIQSLIVLSLISFTAETLPGLTQAQIDFLRIFETATVLIFTVEYLLRIIVADSKKTFIFSFYGIIDLLAILPFYIATGVDLRSVRVFRLFRLFRTFKMFRFSASLQRFKDVFASIKSELYVFAVATVFLLYVSSVGIYHFERDAQAEAFASIIHCFWWAVATLTTVGYGDVYPITAGGKVFTSFIVLIGIGIVAVPTGLLASALTKSLSPDE